MKKYLLIPVITIILTVSILAGNNRIISMAPALTDILTDLEVMDSVVGVTSYCKIPENYSKKVSEIGSALNPSYERILRLNPDLVLLYEENNDIINFLEKNDFEYLTFRHKKINHILNTVKILGNKLDKKNKAKLILNKINKTISQIKKETNNNKRKKAIVVIGRNINTLENIYIAGDDEFIGEILNILNIENGYSGNIAYPKVSLESIIAINPDIIIEVMPELVKKYDKKKIKDDWLKIDNLKAVKNNNIIIMGENFRIVPSTDIVNILKKLKMRIYGNKN